MPQLGIALFGADRFGRRSLPGSAEIITTRRLRKWATGSRTLYHRVPNGIHDPLTFFHVIVTLLDVRPNERFTAKDLVFLLEHNVEHMSWDPVTVGRVIGDIRESIIEANDGPEPIVLARHWQGNRYYVSDQPEAREALARLADDFYDMAEEVVQEERQGIRRRRIQSPISAAPSVARPTAA